MSKFFSICTDPLTFEQEKALQDVVAKAAWWKWMPNYWLVKDSYDRFTADTLRDAVRTINPSARVLVLQVDPITWSAMTKPNAEGRQMTAWIKEQWAKD